MSCTCYIVPQDVLLRLSTDKSLSAAVRKGLVDTARVSSEIRKLRTQAGLLTTATQAGGALLVELAATPKVTVYDCKHSQTLPGTQVANPQKSKDATPKRAFA